jgi:hypothetical protein
MAPGFAAKLGGCRTLPMSLTSAADGRAGQVLNYFSMGCSCAAINLAVMGELEKAAPTQQDRSQSGTKFMGRGNYTPQKAILYR